MKVMVTGATGFVAGWVIKRLLEEGYTVHAAVRNPNHEAKLEHLNKLASELPGTIKYFQSDLLKPGSYAEAMSGCELVFHTASPFTSNFKDPQKELIEPALLGTQNVLQEANNHASVKRVVLTSSCAAIYTDCTDIENTPHKVLTEDIWNTTASLNYQPYSYSKTIAEKEAWKIAKEQNQWKLVVINPSFVMGPALNPRYATSESITILKQLGNGTMKMGVPNLGVGLVDVRDVAEAHFRAATFPEAHGRNICSAHNTSMLEMARALYSEFGKDYPIPNKAMPKWLVMLVGPLVNKALTRRFIKNNVNHPWKADNTKIKTELKMDFRPMKETMVDSFRALIDAGVV